MRASFCEGEIADEAEEGEDKEEEEGEGEERRRRGGGVTPAMKMAAKRIIRMPLHAWAYAFIPRIRSWRLKWFTLPRRTDALD